MMNEYVDKYPPFLDCDALFRAMVDLRSFDLHLEYVSNFALIRGDIESFGRYQYLRGLIFARDAELSREHLKRLIVVTSEVFEWSQEELGEKLNALLSGNQAHRIKSGEYLHSLLEAYRENPFALVDRENERATDPPVSESAGSNLGTGGSSEKANER